MKTRLLVAVFALTAAAVLYPHRAFAQQSNVPATAQQVTDDIEEAVRRFGVGVKAGVALDPELIDFGAHATFGPIFRRGVSFRPGLEFGVGEITTTFAINLDVLYAFPASTGQRWTPYLGAGPNFALSHRGFSTEETDNVDVTTGGTTTTTDRPSRFNFSDTDFKSGFNFIAGARNRSGMFFEMAATAYGVSNIRLLAGFNF